MPSILILNAKEANALLRCIAEVQPSNSTHSDGFVFDPSKLVGSQWFRDSWHFYDG